MADLKNIGYLNKDFNSLKQALIDYTKTYFPNNFTDLTDSQPGMLLIEQSAAIGDLLSFYQENQIQENFLLYAKERENLLNMAYIFGYRPKITSPSIVNLDLYQLIPAITVGAVTTPNMDYSLVIDKGAICYSNNIPFITQNLVDFSMSSSYDNTEVNVYSIDPVSNQPTYYLLKKQVQAISGFIKQATFSFGAPERFPEIILDDTNIVNIISIVDSSNNTWYEVPFLAQETIFEELQNSYLNNPNLYQYTDTPYLLKLKKVSRRFTSKFRADDKLVIQFGSSYLSSPDETLIPNLDNIGIGLVDGLSKLNVAYDPSNFLYTNTYGIAPYNTTLTVTYLVGGGIESNVDANTINTLSTVNANFKTANLNQAIADQIRNSLAVNNTLPSTGGGSGDTNEDIRLKSIAAFSAQNRSVTKDDYLVRTLSMPARFGAISKAYITQDQSLNVDTDNINFINNNPLALSLYILSFNNLKQLTQASYALKKNLKVYLDESRIITDAINIKDAFIINIGIKFEILTLPNFNSQEVLNNCITTLKDYFNIDKWQINQPIIISDIRTLLDKINGVQTVINIHFENKVGTNAGYSQYAYDIKSATKNNIIYPSLDPCIFEIKYPNTDILGKISSL